MHLFLAELSEQTATALTTSLFSAGVTVGLGTLVFAGTQYMTWRLEITKHLRTKLEDLVNEVLKVQSAIMQDASQSADTVLIRQAGGLSTAKIRIIAVQTVYFPELSTRVTALTDNITELALTILELDSNVRIRDGMTKVPENENNRQQAAREEILVEKAKLCEEDRKKVSSLIRVVLNEAFELLRYIAADNSHLVGMPQWLAKLLGLPQLNR